jgi:para-nitrobenzyl esterase
MKADVDRDVVIQTTQGAVRGRLVDGVAAFKGIPYAAPPFGPHRFRPPQPHAPWAGVRDALTYGPTAPKPPYPPSFDFMDQALPDPVIPGEDCLNLNIWTPDPGRVGLPVLVWIHGGGIWGSGAVPTYDGRHFARDGVVCVTINYRLGVDGFLYLDGAVANRGLLDQIAALEWVRENIAAFGGDPGNVTIFGESFGAMSVATLLAMPRATGLFRRAIAQSVLYVGLSAATAQRVSQALARKLGVVPTQEAIAAVPLDRLLQAELDLVTEIFAQPDPERWGEVVENLGPFGPVVDGEVLPGRPIERLAAGAGAHSDLLVGSNAEEWRFMLVPTGQLDLITEEMLAGQIAAYGLPVQQTLATYREARPGASAGDLLAAVVTDWRFRIPAIRLAEAYSQGPRAAYMYEFAWRSPQYAGRLGACHGLELPFVFDNLDGERPGGFVGAGRGPQQLADATHRAWVAFAARGDPGWPRYDPVRRATMRFALPPQVVEDPGAAERALWEGKR